MLSPSLMAGASRGVNDFLIRLNNYDQHASTARHLSQVFEAQHVQILNTLVGHDDSTASLADGLFGTMRVLSIIALLLSIFLLLGTVSALVTEQLQIIGTMKSIGAGRSQVMRHYLNIVLVYGVVGTAIGLGLGILGGYMLISYFANLLNLDVGPLDVSPLLLVESIAIGIGVPLVAAALPVYFGTRITVREALSGYGLDSGNMQYSGR